MSEPARWITLVFAVGLGLVLLDRLFLAFEARGWIFYRKRKAQLPARGSVLLQLSVVLEPDKQYVVEARRQEPREEKHEGAAPPADDQQKFVVPP